MKSGETKERSKVPPKMNENRMKKRDNAGKNDILCLETKDCSKYYEMLLLIFLKLPILTAQLLPPPCF